MNLAVKRKLSSMTKVARVFALLSMWPQLLLLMVKCSASPPQQSPSSSDPDALALVPVSSVKEQDGQDGKIAMSQEAYEKLLQYYEKKQSKSWFGVLFDKVDSFADYTKAFKFTMDTTLKNFQDAVKEAREAKR